MTDILIVLKRTGALLTGSHFVYTSGAHGPAYINKDLLYTHTDEASLVGKEFAKRVVDLPIEVVAAPAIGGIVLTQWTAYHLSRFKKKEVLSVYTEKTDLGEQVFTRGYEKFVKGKNVFVVEDLTSTGSSVKKVIGSVRNAGGNVIQVGVMVDRSPIDRPMTDDIIGAPFFALGRFPVELYKADSCILCAKNVPINIQAGHGKKFLRLKNISAKIIKKGK